MAARGVISGSKYRTDWLSGKNALSRTRDVADSSIGQPRLGITYHDVVGGKDHSLSNSRTRGSRMVEIEIGQLALTTCCDVCAKHRKAISLFHELHGRRPSWIDFNGVRNSVPCDEIDPVDANEPKLAGDSVRERLRRCGECLIMRKSHVAERHENVAAIAITAGAKYLLTDQLPRESHRNSASIGGNKHNRPLRSFDVFLQIGPRGNHSSRTP